MPRDRITGELYDDDWTPEDRLRELWLAVLVLAIDDTRRQWPDRWTVERWEARKWPSRDEDFEMVCDYAGVEPKKARAYLKLAPPTTAAMRVHVLRDER